jgi:8-hydroxy-5-deazaflavin:NADPH oxidoreductase
VRIGFIGAGHIGGNAARLFAAAGHEVMLSFAREPERLAERAAAIGERACVGTPAEAAKFGEVTMLSVQWPIIPLALEQAGSLRGIVIDTTNQFERRGVVTLPGGISAAAYNQQRLPGTSVVKSFNTLTSGFQAAAAGRPVETRVAMFLSGEDAGAKGVVAVLIKDAGFEPVDLGGFEQAHLQEAPRRAGAVYGEEYRLPAALEVLDAVRAGRPVPPPPKYA